MSFYHTAPLTTAPEPASSLELDATADQKKLIYYAAPMSTHAHAEYDAGLSMIKERYPYATVLSSRDIYHSNRQWKGAWPGLLCIITTLIFIADSRTCEEPTIGYGVYTEIADCAAFGIPVLHLTPDQDLIPYCDLEITPLGEDAPWQRYASIGRKEPGR